MILFTAVCIAILGVAFAGIWIALRNFIEGC